MEIHEVYDEIDFFVKKVVEKGVISNTMCENEKLSLAFRYLKSENIIVSNGTKSQFISGMNSFVIKKKGIELFLKEKEYTENLEKKIKELSIKDLKGNIFQNKYWWIFIIINFFISIAIVFIGKFL
ncbi:hypothetical protein QWY81_00635 [Polaribacter undariae]|uniref:Uncharacterized protein n=1 Tax=Polaribacter sejongensis TaxID=985043 RepID=A0AAJ1VF23_9FLAO|nr:hypothetical protein [Polaribacter undariae]MDN3617954.1 hypothetical protein [Polaribacter undariae]UWD32014.1 hypothetical protein NQP51_18030 [Polaribacter undariae]